jgi:hypothetical protein
METKIFRHAELQFSKNLLKKTKILQEICKIKKTRHQNPKLGPKLGEIQKKLAKKYVNKTQKCTIFVPN